MKEYYCEACGRKHNGKYSSHYCRKHQWELKKYGKLLDNNPRTKFDPNEFRFKNNYVEFDTYNVPKLDVNKTYKIDVTDYPLVSRYKWRTIKGYAATTINNKNVFLHVLLMNPKDGQTVDHINTDVSDNRKNNLRITTHTVQSMNRKGYNKYGIKGIEIHSNKYTSSYSAYLRIYGKQYHSPCYDNIEKAKFARFIMEQMFCSEILYQSNSYILKQEDKVKIINDLKIKFNR